MTTRQILDTLALLTPYDLLAQRKIRVGNPTADGGYILLDRLRPEQLVLSFGVGGDISFELDMAQRGHRVLMFDHTVAPRDLSNPLCSYFPEGLTGTTEPGGVMYSLEDHVARRAADAQDMILKMDVEGWEWMALDTASPETLARFEQITFEAHGFDMIEDPGHQARLHRVLGRLNRSHVLFHVHANNVAPLRTIRGLPVSQLLELSYVRADIAERVPSATFYPTPLDVPNVASRPELMLWHYPFLPTAWTTAARAFSEERRAAAERVDAQYASPPAKAG